MAGENIHVVYDKHNWAVKREGSKYNMSTHSSQEMAIDVARASAEAAQSDLVVFNRNGQINDTTSFRKPGSPENPKS